MKKSWILLALCLALACFLAAPASAAGYLDEMQRYDVVVTVQNDGSAIIEYSVDWKVLDDDSYGPLEWVKIGVPHAEVTDLTALSHDTISEIGLMWEDGDVYARIDLDRYYYAGETVRIQFSLHATHLYTVDGTAVNYSFTPGWFSEAETRQFSLLWQNAGGQAAPQLAVQADGDSLTQAAAEGGGVRIACQNLPADGRVTVTTQYQTSDFADGIDATQTADNLPQDNIGDYPGNQGADVFVMLMFVILVLVILMLATSRYGRSSRHWHGGFGSTIIIDEHGHRHIQPAPPSGGAASPKAGGGESRGAGAGRRSSGGGCACACACVSCACACACAGGGRAGCSAKQLRGYDAKALLAALKNDKTKEEPA